MILKILKESTMIFHKQLYPFIKTYLKNIEIKENCQPVSRPSPVTFLTPPQRNIFLRITIKLRDATNNLLSIANPDDIKVLKKEI